MYAEEGSGTMRHCKTVSTTVKAGGQDIEEKADCDAVWLGGVDGHSADSFCLDAVMEGAGE